MKVISRIAARWMIGGLLFGVFSTYVLDGCSTPRPYTGEDAGIDGSTALGGSGRGGAQATGGGSGGAGIDAGGGIGASSGGSGAIGSGGASVPGSGGDGVALGAGGATGAGGEASSAMGGMPDGTGGHGGSSAGSGGSAGLSGAAGAGTSTGGSSSGGRTGSAGGTSTAGRGGSGGTGGGGSISCSGPNQMLCSEQCVDTATDILNCGHCNSPCGGTCQSGVCCALGKVNCGGACVDISSDNSHCGACQGPTATCDATSQCTGGACRGLDGQPCTANGDCVSGACRIFYGDQDGDGFPSQTDRKGWCGASASSGNPAYLTARPDGKWDCCDQKGADWIYPGAPASGNWSTVVGSVCGIPFGDTNCDGQVIVSNEDIASCNLQPGNACTPEYTYHPPTDCGITISGCNCAFSSSDNSCYIACFVSEHLQCQ